MTCLMPITDPSAPTAIAERLRPAILRLARQLRHSAQRLGVSSVDTVLLAAIVRSPGIGVTELAAQEGMKPPTMSGHVKRLEEAGLIGRSRSEDGRRSQLRLSQAGERLHAAIRQQRTDWLAERLAGLPDGERAAVAGALAALTRLAE